MLIYSRANFGMTVGKFSPVCSAVLLLFGIAAIRLVSIFHEY